MTISCSKKKDTLIARLDGELDHHHSDQVREELDNKLEDESIKNLVFDLENLRFMDSSGIGVFIGRYKKISKRGGKTCVANISPHLQKIIQLSGLLRIIKPYDSVDKALNGIWEVGQ